MPPGTPRVLAVTDLRSDLLSLRRFTRSSSQDIGSFIHG